MTIDLSEREVFVIVNALNYAKNEWAMFDGDMIDRDDELLALADDADKLEVRLQQEQQQ